MGWRGVGFGGLLRLGGRLGMGFIASIRGIIRAIGLSSMMLLICSRLIVGRAFIFKLFI